MDEGSDEKVGSLCHWNLLLIYFKPKITDPSKTKKFSNDQKQMCIETGNMHASHSINAKRIYDLEERTATFAAGTRVFVRKLPRGTNSRDDIDQLIRSSGSVAANYLEANESLGKGDFIMRTRISLKEAKESRLWLRLLSIPPECTALEAERKFLLDEAHQFVRIFSTILKRVGATKKSFSAND